MMKEIKPRIPEGGAIVDSSTMNMEHYSKTMKKQLGKEYARFAENIVNKLSPDCISQVLEIGPGPGWAGINLLIKQPNFYLEGLEASPDMIRVAKNNAKEVGVSDRVHYSEGMAEEMKNLPDNFFDIVISRDSLHHWISPEKVFKEINRVLKDNGKIYIHDHRRDLNFGGRIIVNVLGPIVSGKMVKYWKSSIAAAYTKEEIENILMKIGYTSWSVETELMDLVIIKK